jgi:serine/threonine protein kinase
MHNPAVLARFHREARVASRLNHPNVVQVLMSGELILDQRVVEGDSESGTAGSAAYLVMEHLDGASLAAMLQSRTEPLPLERALHIALQVCDAVGEAHGQGIVHRDIKPENVMLVRRGSDADFVKVLDFGVAKLDWLDGAQATQAGTVFGTARYISPEGACGEDVTPSSDVYSIATLLYQCLSGRTPFDGNNTVAVLVKQRAEQPPDLRALVPGIPEPIALAVHRNLAKAPGDRAATARDFGAELLAAARASNVDPGALADRPTLHGSRSVPPVAPMDEAPPLDRPKTLIDPELAHIPAGGTQQRAVRPWTEIAPIPDLAAERDAIDRSGHSYTPPAVDVAIPVEQFDAGAPSRRNMGMSRGARWALGLATFASVSAVCALLLARQMRTAPATLDAELDRANSALAVGAWRTDDKQGFIDVTDAALLRYPDSEKLLELRRRGAGRLARDARKAEDTDPTKARDLARLARALAPKDQEIERLTAPLLDRVTNQPIIAVGAQAGSAKPPAQKAPSGTPSMLDAAKPPESLPIEPAQSTPSGTQHEHPVYSAKPEEPQDGVHEEPAPEPAPAPVTEEPPPEDSGEDEPRAPGGRWL